MKVKVSLGLYSCLHWFALPHTPRQAESSDGSTQCLIRPANIPEVKGTYSKAAEFTISMKICAPEVKKYQLKVLKVLHAISIQFSSTCIAHCASSSTAFRSNESILMLVGVHLWCGQSDFHVRPQTDCLLFRVPAHSQQPASERAAHLALSRTSYTSELPQDCSFPCNPWTSIV